MEARTTGRGAPTGKIGGFVGVFTFPMQMHWHGLLTAELGAAIASALGLLSTVSLLPETMRRTLEELSIARV